MLSEIETSNPMHAERQGELPSMMQVMFEHVPDHPLASLAVGPPSFSPCNRSSRSAGRQRSRPS